MLEVGWSLAGAGVGVKNASMPSCQATGHTLLSPSSASRSGDDTAQSHSLMLCSMDKLSGSVHGSGSANKRDVQILSRIVQHSVWSVGCRGRGSLDTGL